MLLNASDTLDLLRLLAGDVTRVTADIDTHGDNGAAS
jgi:hypothetical protein